MKNAEQLKATRAAAVLIPLLPDCIWTLSVGDEADASVLNIYIGSDHWKALALKLNLPETPTDKGGGYVSYLRNALLVSFIDEESEYERDEREHR